MLCFRHAHVKDFYIFLKNEPLSHYAMPFVPDNFFCFEVSFALNQYSHSYFLLISLSMVYFSPSIYRHISEIFWVWFQTTAVKQTS